MLTLHLLGSPQIQLNLQPVSDLTSAKSQALLFFLALNGRPQSRLRLAGLLWPDKSDQEARVNLRQTLYLLRLALPGIVASTRATIGLNEQMPREIDALHFETEINIGLAGDIGALQSAVERYRGDLLAGFFVDEAPDFDEWLLVERERLRSLFVQGLSQLSDHYTGHQEIGPGIHYTSKLLALEPWREESHRNMMRLLAWSGQIQAALAQYERCRQLLADELHITPAPETTTLWQQIQTGEFGRADSPRPAPGLSAHPPPIVAWGDAPVLTPLYGRTAELAQLEKWVLAENSRVVAVLGLGGQGKTALAATFARAQASTFDVLLWRTMLNAPPLADMLQNWLERLAPETAANIAPGLDDKLDLLFRHLRQKRCLLILDNAESIMQSGQHAGSFRDGYEPYAQLLHRFALGDHQSCLLLTSREKPKQFAQLERRRHPIHSLVLPGLELVAGQAILQEENLLGSTADMETLIGQYSGNPLALILIADTIHDLYGGDIRAFLMAETVVFENIQAVLAQQFSRLTALEVQIMLWLTVEREAVDVPALMELIRLPHTPGELLMALHSLQRRSLIEKRGEGFTLQNVLMEFTTDYLVATVFQEVVQGQLEHLARLPLLKARAKTYVRRAQERLLLRPIAHQLSSQGGHAQAVALLKELLASLPLSVREYSYAGGNILNLLLYLGAAEALDFSGTAVWQAYLRGKILPPINFTGADLTGAVFTDYGGKIITLVFSPDGTRLAGSAGTGELRVWDVTTRQPWLTLDGHQDFVAALCFSPDGRFLVSGGGDGLACLWDAETGRRLHTFPAHDNAINAVVYAPDGTWIAGASFNRLAFWDPVSGETLFNQSFRGGYINALAASQDGKILALNNRNSVLLWDVRATLAARIGQPLHELHGHEALVRRLAFSPDNQWVASSGDAVCVWTVATGQCLHRFTVADSRIWGIAIQPENGVLAGGSEDMIYLWQIKTGELIRAFAAHEQRILSLAYAPGGQILASSSQDYTIRLWDGEGQILHTIQGYVNMIHTVDVSPDGRFLACGSEDRKVRLWDYHSGELLAAWEGHHSLIWRVTFSPDGRFLAACSHDPMIRVRSVPSGEELYRVQTGASRNFSLVYSPDGRWLATGDRDGTLSLWHAASGHRKQMLHHQTAVCTVAFHPDGLHLATVCFDQKIYLWEIESGRCVRILAGHDNEVWALSYSRDGCFLVSGSDDYTVRFWQVATGECSYTLEDHAGWVQTLAFNHIGNLLATGSQDKRVRLWDVTSINQGQPPQLVHILTGHTARVTAVCFTPDDATVVSGSLDETMRFWQVTTGECRQTWPIPGPYTGMDITGVTGLTPAQRSALKALGAVARA